MGTGVFMVFGLQVTWLWRAWSVTFNGLKELNRLVAINAAEMSQPDRQSPKGDLSCLVDLVPDMASLMQAERNVGAKNLVILGGLVLVSPLPKTEWEQLGAR